MNEQQFWSTIWNDWFYTAMIGAFVVTLFLDSIYSVAARVNALDKTIKEKE